MKLLTILAVLLAIATPASARIVNAWQCGNVDVELHKYATKAYELRFAGTFPVWGTRSGINFRYVGLKGANLNGRPCRVLAYNPKWDEKD